MSDVLVIGAGLAGLSAAALLSREGIPVTVIEEEQDLGGRLRSLSREGFRLDAGLHGFHYADAGPIGELNRRLGLGLSFLEIKSESYLLLGKRRMPVPADAETAPAEVPGFSASELSRMHRFFAALLAADVKEFEKTSLAEFLSAGEFAEDELVKGYAAAMGLSILGRVPEEISAGILMAHRREVGHAGFHVSAIAGGPGRLIEGLAAGLSRDHSRVILGARVLELEIKEGAVARVATVAEEFAPAAVIFAGGLKRLPALITGEKISGLARACQRLKMVAGIALELGLDAAVSEIAGVMIDPVEAVIARFPSNLDPSLAPKGAQISSWLALVPPEDLEDVKLTGSHVRRLKRLAQLQFPELFDQVKWERLRVIPGLAPAPLVTQTLDKRPAVKVKGVGNLFLAGDSVAAKGLLSGVAVSSAMEAVERVKKLLSEG